MDKPLPDDGVTACGSSLGGSCGDGVEAPAETSVEVLQNPEDPLAAFRFRVASAVIKLSYRAMDEVGRKARSTEMDALVKGLSPLRPPAPPDPPPAPEPCNAPPSHPSEKEEANPLLSIGYSPSKIADFTQKHYIFARRPNHPVSPQ